MSLNLAVILEESTKRNPDKVAIIFDDFKLTYAQLDAAANQVANGLVGAGIKPGDRVGMMLPNVPQFPIIYFGILKAGAIVVPMNVLLKDREVAYYLSDSEASAFFYWDMFAKDAVGGAQEATSVKKLIQVGLAPAETADGIDDFFAFMGTQAPTFDSVATKADDTCLIIYTSGTTGKPKGAELTNLNLFECCHLGTHIFTFAPETDVIMAGLPLFPPSGLRNVVNGGVPGAITPTLMPRFHGAKGLAVIAP